MYLSYYGIRVTDLPRSVDFYMRTFGLTLPPGSQAPTENPPEATGVMLVDPHSGLRIELNYYPVGNPYAVPYVPGEGWDHLAFRVDDLTAFLAKLGARGIAPEKMKHYDGPMMATPNFRVGYFRDPDGNQIELYDSPGADPNRYDPNAY